MSVSFLESFQSLFFLINVLLLSLSILILGPTMKMLFYLMSHRPLKLLAFVLLLFVFKNIFVDF